MNEKCDATVADKNAEPIQFFKKFKRRDYVDVGSTDAGPSDGASTYALQRMRDIYTRAILTMERIGRVHNYDDNQWMTTDSTIHVEMPFHLRRHSVR